MRHKGYAPSSARARMLPKAHDLVRQRAHTLVRPNRKCLCHKRDGQASILHGRTLQSEPHSCGAPYRQSEGDAFCDRHPCLQRHAYCLRASRGRASIDPAEPRRHLRGEPAHRSPVHSTLACRPGGSARRHRHHAPDEHGCRQRCRRLHAQTQLNGADAQFSAQPHQE